jgi:hypothetical protein
MVGGAITMRGGNKGGGGVLVYADPGADADDQLAIREAKRNGIPITLVIGGNGKLSDWEKFNALGSEDEKGTDNTTPIKSYAKGTLGDIILKPKYLVVIAPGIDKILKNIDLTNCKKIYYMGNELQFEKDLNAEENESQGGSKQERIYLTSADIAYKDYTGPGFNDTDGSKFRKIVRDKKIPVRVVTSKEGDKRMCNMELFKELGLTKAQINRSINSAFTLLLGRMNPEWDAANEHAEGLVSGPRANNKKQLEIMLEATGKVLPVASIELKNACKSYINKLETSILKIPGKKSALCGPEDIGPLFNKQDALNGLLEVALLTTAIIGREPLKGEELIVSGSKTGKFYDLKKEHKNEYTIIDDMVKKKGVGLAPAFDLITMEYLIKDYYSADGEDSQGKYIVLGGRRKSKRRKRRRKTKKRKKRKKVKKTRMARRRKSRKKK